MKSTASLFLGGLDGMQIGTFDSAKYRKNGRHWWATVFNPSQLGRKKDELTAQFNVTFPSRQFYEDFKAKHGKKTSWSFNDETASATLTF